MTGHTWKAFEKSIRGSSINDQINYKELVENYFHSDDFLKNQKDGESFINGRRSQFRDIYYNLDIDTRLALDVYTLESHAVEINKLLIDGVSLEEFPNSTYRNTVLKLDNFINEHPLASEEMVYRGVPLVSSIEESMILEKLENLEPGRELKFKGFTSSSTSFGNAFDFTNGSKGIIYEIYTKSGSFINESVEEVLLSRNSRFTYLDYEICSKTYDYISIKLIEKDLLNE